MYDPQLCDGSWKWKQQPPNVPMCSQCPSRGQCAAVFDRVAPKVR